MASTTNQVALSTSAALITAGDPNSSALVKILNPHATITVYWGYASGVTSTTGVQILAGDDSGWIPLDTGESIYAVAASGTPTVQYARSRARVV